MTTWVYIAWSLLPVLLAIRFAFNSGRSRTSLQGWSLRWFWKDPTLSVLPRPDAAWRALKHSLVLAAARRWSSPRRSAPRWRSACSAGAGPAPAWPTSLMLLPLVTPELVFAVGMFLLFTTAFGVHRAGHAGAGDRPRDVLALLGGADRARAAGDDRARRRGGGGRPRRAAAARSSRRVLLPLLAAGDGGEPAGRRSRCRSTTSSSPVPGLGRRHDDGADAHLLAGARRARRRR